MLQENGRDYKRLDDIQVENSTNSFENPTEAVVEEIVQPARLVSSSSAESDLIHLPLTTALTTSVRFSTTQPPVTTARIPTIFRSTTNFSQPARPFYPSPTMPRNWRLRQFSDMQQSPSSPYHSTDFHSSPGPTSMIMMRDKWRNKSGCYYSCIQQAKGLQTVVSKYDFSSNVQLCEPTAAVGYLL